MTEPWSAMNAEALAARVPTLAGWPYGSDLRMERITSGTTNVNWRMVVGDATFFLKVPGLGSEAFIDRRLANEAAVVAHGAGVGPASLYFDPASGVEVSEFLDGYRSSSILDLMSEQGSLELMRLYRRAHSGPLLSTTKTLFDMIDEHIEQVSESGRTLQPYQLEVQHLWRPVQQRYIAQGLDLVPGHNDPNPSNFMVKDGAPMKLIDYDYAANTDRYYELGAIMTPAGLPEEAQLRLLAEYSGTPDAGQRARLYLSGVGTLVKWGYWALYNSAVRDDDFDYEKYGAAMLIAALTRLRSERCAEAFAAL